MLTEKKKKRKKECEFIFPNYGKVHNIYYNESVRNNTISQVPIGHLILCCNNLQQ